MSVTLRVSNHQSRTLGADAVRVFARGGTIGRAPDNDWVLPDAERFVSSQHAVISLENGEYILTDRSTNGTIVNGRELAQGSRVRLSSGDTLTIGNYEISVSIDAASDDRALRAAGMTPASDARPDVPLGAPASVDPLDFFSDPGSPSVAFSSAGAGAEPDHIPAEAEFFPPPRVEPERSSASDTASGSFIPEDWDRTGFSMSAGDPPGAAGDDDLFGATLPPPGNGGRAVPPPDSARPSISYAAPPADAARPGIGDASAPVDAARTGIDYAVPPAEAASRDIARTVPQADRSLPGNGPPDDGSLDALLRAAGLDPAAVDAETRASFGEILRVVVGGLMEVLRARAELKNQFRVAMTTLKPVENNPLKFSANADDALFNLLTRRGQSFQAPVDAFREAFDDLKAHQIAMMAGMRAAFGSLLKRFDPDALQTTFDRGLKRASILDVINKTKYWELYREMYEELGDDDTTFRRLFGDEFAEAYEEQMQRLTALHKR